MRLIRDQYNTRDIIFKNDDYKVHDYYHANILQCYADKGQAKELVLI